jgi:hypothetical protein
MRPILNAMNDRHVYVIVPWRYLLLMKKLASLLTVNRRFSSPLFHWMVYWPVSIITPRVLHILF